MMASDYKIGDHVGIVDLLARNAVVEKPAPKHWYVLEVRPGRDAMVMRTFRRNKIDAYSPQIRRTEIVHGRKREVVVPLFPGLIMLPDYESLLNPRLFDGVIGFVTFGDFFMRLRPDGPDGMEQIRRIEAICNVPLSKRKRMFNTGQLVRVVDGPFAAFSGQIERLDSKGRLSVLVNIFGRLSPVVLDEGQIEPDDTPTGASHALRVARHKQRRIPRPS
ncbi:transcription termination/antitermination protein NusG [Tardiphaga sp. 709]|uniref:transcription termination/antitermination protein NusG n=1 Tax=Tardiphaga sp. 709 TaxID=3076039 RepID=UPI0028E73970|nr:transcription termination/antitermination NusG family protein [Tardiphaga sp. 709]WNV10111.1 transcription termination/antitermination NusG family protein [Tardiphaga sp. 709]